LISTERRRLPPPAGGTELRPTNAAPQDPGSHAADPVSDAAVSSSPPLQPRPIPHLRLQRRRCPNSRAHALCHGGWSHPVPPPQLRTPEFWLP
jgi:hypothetical protein